MFDLSSRPMKIEAYQVEEIDGELLMYHAGKNASLYINEPAAMVWYLCDGNRTVSEIIQLLSESFPDSEGDIAQDVNASLTELFEFGGLLENKE